MALSKSRFVKGVQCHRLLWWTVHEPDAKELQPDKVLQDLFDQGRHAGELARTRYPDGVLIDLPHRAYDERVAATQKAMDDGAPAIFEATFIADDTYVAIDVLSRAGDGYHLTEVKASTSQKNEHIPDVAVQARVAAACSVKITRAEVMHLNKEFRHPDSGDLFAHTDVTEALIDYLPGVADEIERQHAILAGPIPEIAIGQHCFEPHDCPFMARCWPNERDHIINLADVGPKRGGSYLKRGIKSIHDIPKTEKLNFTQKRQLKAIAKNEIVVEPTLREKLLEFESPLSRREWGTGGEDHERGTGGEDGGSGGHDWHLGFLDFETVSRAVPVWRGMGPWHQAAAQFSYHELQPDGSYTHAAHLAEGPQDSRPPLAEAMVSATARADRVVMYTPFERTQIRDMQRAAPHLSDELEALEAKLIDLCPVVRNCVYHPDFRGSFSLKAILTPLCPDLTYNDLVIVDGRVASVEIARLLFVADKIPQHERDRVRQDLLDYCERDTWAMVRLLEELRKLAGLPPKLRVSSS
jgi:hypothetical protein